MKNGGIITALFRGSALLILQTSMTPKLLCDDPPGAVVVVVGDPDPDPDPRTDPSWGAPNVAENTGGTNPGGGGNGAGGPTSSGDYSNSKTTNQFLGQFSSSVNWHVSNNSVTGGDCYPSAAVYGCDCTCSTVAMAQFGSSASIGAQFTLKKAVVGQPISTIIGYHRWSLNADGTSSCDDSTIANAKFSN